MKFEDSKAAVAIRDAHGIYIAQVFAQQYETCLRTTSAVDPDDINSLLAGPDHPDYMEAYSDLFPVTLTDGDGKRFVFAQVGESANVWEIPEEEYNLIEWEEI